MPEYRYPLTRVCLRGGAMTLPRTMIGLFPTEGSFVAVDALTGAEHTLYMSHPRVVAGLGPMFREHGLEVNDELVISQAGESRYMVTPVLRSTLHGAAGDSEGVAEDVLATAEQPAGEGGLADDDGEGPSADGDHGGAAHAAAEADQDYGAAEAGATGDVSYHSVGGVETQAGAETETEATGEPDGAAGQVPGQAAGSTPGYGLDPRAAVTEAESALADLEGAGAQVGGREEPRQGTLWGEGSVSGGSVSGGSLDEGSLDGGAVSGRGVSGGSVNGGAVVDAGVTEVRSGHPVAAPAADGSTEAALPEGSPGAEPGVVAVQPAANPEDVVQETPPDQPAEQAGSPAAWPVAHRAGDEERGPSRARQAGRGAAFEDEDDNDAALAAIALTSRVRRVFSPVGFRIEPLAAGVAYLHAEMGRRRYKVLVQTLRSGERLDWAGLLSRRRNSPANYLAVMGDRADLVRLTNPANLARATLWSWEALARLEELHGSVAVTPLDLESHFDRDGLFEQGLKRFEQGVAARIAERGAASEVLTRLARLRAPTVFLLEELAQDVNFSRDAVLRILDRFSEAPMHLVAKVDNGEFLLRQPVDEALASLAAYADSLRQRLPNTRREVITGLDDHGASPESQLLDDTTGA